MSDLKPVEPLILTVRGKKVILDSDLAAAYGVETRVLNQAVKRNADRFPEDFMIQLTREEWRDLKSQVVISSSEGVDSQPDKDNRSQSVTGSVELVGGELDKGNRSQIATGSQKHRDPRSLPRVFTEHGAIMAASVLNSPKAVEMSVFVVRAFVKMREQLAVNAEILRRLAEIDKTLLEHNDALRTIWNQLQPLLIPSDPPKKGRIGFDAHIQ